MTRRFNILVGIIPIFGNQVLLTQRSQREKFHPGKWGLTCGKIDFGETLEDAVERELSEETALVCSSKKMVGYSEFPSEKDGQELHNLQINFVAGVSAPAVVKLDDSSDDYKWVPIDSCHNHDLDDFALSMIAQALGFEIKM